MLVVIILLMRALLRPLVRLAPPDPLAAQLDSTVLVALTTAVRGQAGGATAEQIQAALAQWSARTASVVEVQRAFRPLRRRRLASVQSHRWRPVPSTGVDGDRPGGTGGVPRASPAAA